MINYPGLIRQKIRLLEDTRLVPALPYSFHSRKEPGEATFALVPCCCMGLGLDTEAGVVDVCRVGVESPFFSDSKRVLTCKVNIRRALT